MSDDDRLTPSRKYSFITVAYGDDFGLLRLQARSLNRYLDRGLTNEIVVIENPHPGRPVNWRQTLRREYGELAEIVRFVDAREVADIPSYVSGWFSQQVLKLLAARSVANDRYVVLDAKNHLVFPLTRGFLETPSGTMRLYLTDYSSHNMRPYLEYTLQYFGLVPDSFIGAFVPTTTPFALPAGVVRDLVREIEAREGCTLPAAFGRGGFRLTEFFLFGAYMIASGHQISDFYDLSGVKCPTIWPETILAEIPGLIAAGEAAHLPVFAIHRKAIPRLEDTARHAVASFWQRRGLFADVDVPFRFLSNFERDVIRAQRSAERLRMLSDAARHLVHTTRFRARTLRRR